MSTTASPTPDLRYPVGRLERRSTLTPSQRREAIDALAEAPSRLRAAVRGLSEAQIDTPYRPGGWTVRQLVHHVADSHMNAYVRMKLALTQDNPTINAYDEAEWAKLPDASLPIEISVVLLERLHDRMVHLLRSLSDEQFARPLMHPENGPMSVDSLLNVYWWHGRHHVAHVTALRERSGWGAA